MKMTVAWPKSFPPPADKRASFYEIVFFGQTDRKILKRRGSENLKDVSDSFRKFEVVGHHNERHTLLFLELEQKFNHLISSLAIESAGWFVCQDELRLINERAGDGRPLFFSAGKFAGPMTQAMTQADPVQ